LTAVEGEPYDLGFGTIVSTSLIGQTLGQYRVIDELGAGGMGVVYKAQDVRLGRLVALKVLPQATSDDEEAVERFRREARTASSLNHPNICTIYSFDEHNGQLYLAMELLEGEPLDRKLAGRPLEFRMLLDYGTQIADALDAAHAEGVLHRDIKPANIFLTRRNQVKILDFGLAKLAAAHQHDATSMVTERFSSMAGTTVGTIAYMSPEQARGEDVDPRTDLFSFGVVLYEMSTGRQSFPGATTAVVFDGILNREPMPPSMVNAQIPAEIDRIISKSLEKDRTLRYQSAADMRADLQRLKRDSGSRRVAAAGASTSGSVVLPGPSGTAIPYSTSVYNSSEVIAPSAGPDVARFVPPPEPPAAAPSSPALPPAASSPAAAAAPAAINRRAMSPMLMGAIAIAAIGVVAIVAVSRMAMSRREEPPPPVEAALEPIGASATADAAALVSFAAPATAAIPVITSIAPATTTAPSTNATPGVPAVVANPVATAKPVPVAEPPKPDPAIAAAAERLDVAKAKISHNVLEPALADLKQIVTDFPGSAAAAEASFTTADVLEKLGRVDDAMGAHVEFANRFPNDRRVPASKLRLAELMSRSKQPNKDNATRDILAQLISAYPATPQALQALQMKIRLDGERRQREMDPVLNIQVPAVLPTLRTLTEQFPTDPSAMAAFSRLAGLYEDLNQWERAAQAWSTLATNFPNNSQDAWFRAGEIYERRLRDTDRARAAFEKVPQGSGKYRDAQRKLQRK